MKEHLEQGEEEECRDEPDQSYGFGMRPPTPVATPNHHNINVVQLQRGSNRTVNQ